MPDFSIWRWGDGLPPFSSSAGERKLMKHSYENWGGGLARLSCWEPLSQCHSEERRDEESACSSVSGPRSSVIQKQILHGVYPEQLCRRIQDDSPAVVGEIDSQSWGYFHRMWASVRS